MRNGLYEIRVYRPDFSSQIADLLKFLWGDEIEKNRRYFKWKYEENPLNKCPIGVVALHKGSVVGFRGCVVTQWEFAWAREKLSVLCMGDTCVHPDHRKKGLFRAMTKKLMQEYADTDYKYFLNLSLNKNSTPVHLKMNWVPLVNKSYMKRYTFASLLNYMLKKKTALRLYKENINFGIFKDIEVGNKPKADQMHSVFRDQKKAERIRLFKDADYFKWRFQNERQKYIFYYHWGNNGLCGYVVARTPSDYSSCHIVDYAYLKKESFVKILRYIMKKRHFDILTIWNLNLENEFLKVVEELGFKSIYLIGRIEERFKPAFPVLIRPIKEKYTQADWFINGVDMRDINNWEINEICSDAG